MTAAADIRDLTTLLRAVGAIDVTRLADTRPSHLRAVAEAALGGLLDGAALRELNPDQAVQQVQQVKGLGPFAAELVVVRGASPRTRLDAEIAERYGPGQTLTEVSEAWRLYRTWAAVAPARSSGR